MKFLKIETLGDFLNTLTYNILNTNLSYDIIRGGFKNGPVDINTLIGEIKGALFDMFDHKDDAANNHEINRFKKGREYFVLENYNGHNREMLIDQYNKEVINEIERYKYYLIESMERHPDFTSEKKRLLNIDPYFSNWYKEFGRSEDVTGEKKAQKRGIEKTTTDESPDQNKLTSFADAISFITPELITHFEEAEQKVTGTNLKFTTDIRCAAWCEFLYTRRYLQNIAKQKKDTISKFAKLRYGRDIMQALESSKKSQRKDHIDKKKNGLPPLKNAFA